MTSRCSNRRDRSSAPSTGWLATGPLRAGSGLLKISNCVGMTPVSGHVIRFVRSRRCTVADPIAACDCFVDDDIGFECVAEHREESRVRAGPDESDPEPGHLARANRGQRAAPALPSLHRGDVDPQPLRELELSHPHLFADQLPYIPGDHAAPARPTPTRTLCS